MAVNNSTIKKIFSWVDFYEELANELLKFKDNRKHLLEILNKLDHKRVSYLRDKKTDEWKFPDIDPFSVFAIFNRGIKNETRFDIAQRFKELFNLKSELPSDFLGIPVAFNTRSYYFDDKKVYSDIAPLWKLFESAINYPNDDSFIDSFNKVLSQKQIGMSMITMALYWIRPYTFITLDSNTQDYLKSNGIQIMKRRDLSGESYLKLIKKIQRSQLPDKEFPKISRAAWISKHPRNEEDRGIVENRESDPIISTAYDLLQLKKNVILQGAPGTGKTYSTAAIALEILGVEYGDTDEMMAQYRELCEQGRIFFTTFHQSMDYEDFVEGVKPEIIKGKDEKPIGVTYNAGIGIFRKVCDAANEAANLLIAKIENSDTSNLLYGINPTVWKVTLNCVGENSIRTDCLANNYICISKDVSEDTTVPDSYLRYIKDDMKEGDIILSCYSLHEIDAIGIVTGKYVKNERNKDFPHSRKVRWIVKNIRENIVHINHGVRMIGKWLYRFPNISLKGILDIINKYTQRKKSVIDNKIIDEKAAVVLIIDEINRGNISKIFGELVTLLEKDKREGDAHPISVTLPYSKEVFSVPSNVYIIGTMNTTDRSTGTLDYAIRRRFAFVTLEAKSDYIPEGKARDLFKDIRSFIENNHSSETDINDLMVGHSYFMPDNEVPLSPDEQLKLRIEYEVAPLLREYSNDELLTCLPEELDKRIASWKELKVYNSSETQVPATSEQEGDDEDQEE